MLGERTSVVNQVYEYRYVVLIEGSGRLFQWHVCIFFPAVDAFVVVTINKTMNVIRYTLVPGTCFFVRYGVMQNDI